MGGLYEIYIHVAQIHVAMCGHSRLRMIQDRGRGVDRKHPEEKMRFM